MKYLCLVYHDPPHPEAPRRPAHPVLAAETDAYNTDLRQSGHLLAAHTLDVTCAATIIRVREGCLVLDDGPCSLTHAQLDSSYLIDARDLNEAIRLASRNPAARLGSIELRAIKDHTRE